MHSKKENVFGGRDAYVYKKQIANLVLEHKPTSILDYGCGKGLQYHKNEIHKLWGEHAQVPTLYDPCWEPYQEKPSGDFDGVLCTDVLEHVPLGGEVSLDDVIEDIFSYAVKFVFISVCSRPAIKKLPNGNNCHASVFPPDWWKRKIKSFSVKSPELDVQVYAEYTNKRNKKVRERII